MKANINLFWEDIIDNKEIIFVLSITWVILFEKVTAPIILSAIILSVLVVVFTDRFLLKGNYEHSYMIGLGTLIHYSARLVYEIYLAGLGVIPTIISEEVDVQLVEIETKLTDELLIDILANSITLTPGTVTADKKGSTLKILALNAPGEMENPRNELIPLRLEEILLNYESKIDGKA